MAEPSKIRRRNRNIGCCMECRRRKLRCDKGTPSCLNCSKDEKRKCVYIPPALDVQSQQKLTDYKERAREMESEFVSRAVGAVVATDDERSTEEENLEPTPLAALDNVYTNSGDDEIMDLGVQMGKMRITERVGGWIRPKLVEEFNDSLRDILGEGFRRSAKPRMDNPKSYIGPGPEYIAPSSGFFFAGADLSLRDVVPEKDVCDQLVAQYFHAVHHMCRCLHRPSFEAQYEETWQKLDSGTGAAATLCAVLFSAVVSMTDADVLRMTGDTRTLLIHRLRGATEFALSKANFLRTTRVEVMQAFVMYLIPLVRAEVSRAHSALVGSAIRLAECMGLHRDGTQYGLPAVETHVRRLIWHQLCFLDMRTCEATGPRPQIRPDDYDTKFPLNMNDEDLTSLVPPRDKHVWTDATLIRIRSECIALRRELWFDIVSLDRKQKSLTTVLVKIQEAWKRLTSTYLPILEQSVPIQALARHILTLGVQGCFINVLHRYLYSTKMPAKLRKMLIESSLTQMEHAIALETDPALEPWKWYKGAFNQYHTALLLMVEVYAHPERPDAKRIWRCLDFILEVDPELTPREKAATAIMDLRDRVGYYLQVRGVRSEITLEKKLGGRNLSYVRDHNEPQKKEGVMKEEPKDNPEVEQLPLPDFLWPMEDMLMPMAVPSMPPQQEDVNMLQVDLDGIDWTIMGKHFPEDNNPLAMLNGIDGDPLNSIEPASVDLAPQQQQQQQQPIHQPSNVSPHRQSFSPQEQQYNQYPLPSQHQFPQHSQQQNNFRERHSFGEFSQLPNPHHQVFQPKQQQQQHRPSLHENILPHQIAPQNHSPSFDDRRFPDGGTAVHSQQSPVGLHPQGRHHSFSFDDFMALQRTIEREQQMLQRYPTLNSVHENGHEPGQMNTQGFMRMK
ncbi:hypothetical protein K470DRAFT_292425 [Piedraia hortae CBS 480.64]|uniref:Zn(2)-C6 fungal-type domain-containing protein n=1 Tax=Piedraia hortae CBS 480.64 TaxID=1314780 RepID=A0A6A7C9U7_9PEZI|nr:hypothetical protein K470DRAFT_292425 [Piedraia hortae CBS 480.64]